MDLDAFHSPLSSRHPPDERKHIPSTDPIEPPTLILSRTPYPDPVPDHHECYSSNNLALTELLSSKSGYRQHAGKRAIVPRWVAAPATSDENNTCKNCPTMPRILSTPLRDHVTLRFL